MRRIFIFLLFLFFILTTKAAEIYLLPQKGNFENYSNEKVFLKLKSGEKVNTIEVKIFADKSYEIKNIKNGKYFDKLLFKKELIKVGKYKGKEVYYFLLSSYGKLEKDHGGLLFSFDLIPFEKNINLNLYCKNKILGDDSNVMIYKNGKVIDYLEYCKGASLNFLTTGKTALNNETFDFSGNINLKKVENILGKINTSDIKKIQKFVSGDIEVFDKFKLTNALDKNISSEKKNKFMSFLKNFKIKIITFVKKIFNFVKF